MEEKNIKLEGTVENVIYRNDTNGYTIIDIVCDDELITAVGELGNVEVGENLVLQGTYKNHYKFGLQFNVEYCERKLPSDSVNIEKYLASGIIKGIGTALAKRIVAVFGDKTFEVIEKNPERLKDVKGISGKKYKELCSEFKNLLGLRKITNYLAQYDITLQTAIKAYQKFGSDSFEIVKENPYILCSEGIEMDFRKADNMAFQEKISKNSSERIIAGIKYILTANTQNGHSCVPLDKFTDTAIAFLEISENDFYDAYSKAIEENDIAEYQKNDIEFVYLFDYYNAEMNIANHLIFKKDNGNCNLSAEDINILMD
nr:ATP-dependent RecD-like DNA helicase [Oscillospiraceae bacterium]